MANESWYAEAQRRWCRELEVSLFPTRTEAEEFKENMDRMACGGRCIGASGHEIVDLSMARPSN